MLIPGESWGYMVRSSCLTYNWGNLVSVHLKKIDFQDDVCFFFLKEKQVVGQISLEIFDFDQYFQSCFKATRI